MHRAFVVVLLVLLTIFATIYTPTKAFHVIDWHPLGTILFDARTEAGKWLVQASISDSLQVAVQEYKDRHHGKNPPPKFDVWYKFAQDKRSPILDHFPQMATDLLPFWGISPAKVREGVRRAATEPDIALLQVQDGKPQHNLPPGSAYNVVMDDLVDRIKDFAKHLPNMELAVNLDERPRVLAPFDEVLRSVRSGKRNRAGKLLPSVSKPLDKMPVAQSASSDKLKAQEQHFTSVRALREMTALTCPPGTKARAATHWDIRDVCTSCLEPHSQGQFLMYWPASQDICHQSDLLRLHSFHMTPPDIRPLQELLPVFSRAKTDSYSDILLPLRRITEPIEPTTDGFNYKWKKLFWRGKVDRVSTSHEVARGGHQERLVHLVNNPSPSDKTRVLLWDWEWFTYEEGPTAKINELLPIDVAFSSYSPCKTDGESSCNSDPATKEFQEKKKAEEADPLRNQYVMVVDTDDGPPREFLRTLRANSVPVSASIFIEWYTDRLLPWVHFVPVDLRFHALHSTMAYFFGSPKRKEEEKLNGKDLKFEGRPDDGKFIAEQGARWAAKALRKEDEEVFLFRLLLEWGRIVDDNRDGLGFVLP